MNNPFVRNIMALDDLSSKLPDNDDIYRFLWGKEPDQPLTEEDLKQYMEPRNYEIL